MAPERHLVIAAHPDDETIGLGARLARLPDVTVVFATDGAPADMLDARRLGFTTARSYARCRLREARLALALAGVSPARIFSLGGPDGALVERIAEVTGTLVDLLQALGVTDLWSHPYEGGHPDHDATAVCVRAALVLRGRAGQKLPRSHEFTSYHRGPGAGDVVWGSFLDPNGAVAGPAPPVEQRPLLESETEVKRRMLACYESQRAVLHLVPLGAEPARRAPAYHFARAPHAGSLLYELRWAAIEAAPWRARAASELARLGLSAEAAL